MRAVVQEWRHPMLSLVRLGLHSQRYVASESMAQTSAEGALQAHKPKVLVLTGPTAVGKTAISLDLAERLNGEIISADSVQVYKGLDIGSDKVNLRIFEIGASPIEVGRRKVIEKILQLCSAGTSRRFPWKNVGVSLITCST